MAEQSSILVLTVNENDNVTDSNVIGKVLSSYDDDIKFVQEYMK